MRRIGFSTVAVDRRFAPLAKRKGVSLLRYLVGFFLSLFGLVAARPSLIVTPSIAAEPRVTADAALVIAAGRTYGVESIKTGIVDQTLQDMAQQHAEFQAAACVQGHQQWERRFHFLEGALPQFTGFVEVAAESWSHNTREESAPEMFNSWRQSPGHWAAVNGPCSAYGYSMAKGRNGIWYGCGIFAQRRHFGKAFKAR